MSKDKPNFNLDPSTGYLKGITMTDNEKYSKGWTEKLIVYCLHNKYNELSKYFVRNKYVFEGDFSRGSSWESDVFRMTEGGLTIEEEIKCHKTDVAKEQSVKGAKHEFLLRTWEEQGENLRNPKYNPNRKNSKEFLHTCPNKFNFVCQEGLIDEDYVREKYPYAGLIHIKPNGKCRTIIRNKLHPIKIDLTDTLIKKFYNNSNRHDYASYILARDYKHLDKPTAAQLKKIIEKFVSDVKLRYI